MQVSVSVTGNVSQKYPSPKRENRNPGGTKSTTVRIIVSAELFRLYPTRLVAEGREYQIESEYVERGRQLHKYVRNSDPEYPRDMAEIDRFIRRPAESLLHVSG